jgi:hypothetical protein
MDTGGAALARQRLAAARVAEELQFDGVQRAERAKSRLAEWNAQSAACAAGKAPVPVASPDDNECPATDGDPGMRPASVVQRCRALAARCGCGCRCGRKAAEVSTVTPTDEQAAPAELSPEAEREAVEQARGTTVAAALRTLAETHLTISELQELRTLLRIKQPSCQVLEAKESEAVPVTAPIKSVGNRAVCEPQDHIVSLAPSDSLGLSLYSIGSSTFGVSSAVPKEPMASAAAQVLVPGDHRDLVAGDRDKERGEEGEQEHAADGFADQEEQGRVLPGSRSVEWLGCSARSTASAFSLDPLLQSQESQDQDQDPLAASASGLYSLGNSSGEYY